MVPDWRVCWRGSSWGFSRFELEVEISTERALVGTFVVSLKGALILTFLISLRTAYPAIENRKQQP